MIKLPEILKPKRRWLQFSLSTMFLGVCFIAVVCSMLKVRMDRALKQREAVIAIERLGGTVWYDGDFDERGNIARIELSRASRNWFQELTRVDRVDCVIFRGTKITDNSLAYVRGCPEIKRLDLYNTAITDRGLVHLRGLTHLESLDLRRTKVSDAGMVHLERLTNLRSLSVWNDQFVRETLISNECAVQLRGKLPQCSVEN